MAKMWSAKAVLHAARRMPVETYFLSVHTNDVNVKVRDGLLDIKTKTGETPEGYEIFRPRGKFQFPVRREELATILEHLQVSVALTQDVYSLDGFIALCPLVIIQCGIACGLAPSGYSRSARKTPNRISKAAWAVCMMS